MVASLHYAGRDASLRSRRHPAGLSSVVRKTPARRFVFPSAHLVLGSRPDSTHSSPLGLSPEVTWLRIIVSRILSRRGSVDMLHGTHDLLWVILSADVATPADSC